LIYSSLVGLEEYVGDEKIRLNDQTTATINSVADIVFLLSLNDAGGNDRSGAWTKTLPASVSQREVINEAYFHDRILLDCKPDGTLNDFAGKVPKQVVEQLQNVLRITFQSGDQVVVRSGLIVADESVITVGRLDRWERKWDSFPGGQVQLVKCGELIQSHAVTAVERLSDSPLFKLTVPGLKLPSSSPRLALDATSNDATPDEAHLLGYVRRSDQLFAASSPTSPPGIDNDNQWIMSGSIQTGRRPSVIGEQWREDHTIRFATDMPYAAGLVGSPILADNGAVLGFVDRGSANSGHLRRSLGVSAAPLATVLASGDTSKPKKTSPRRGPVSTR
jgi:hypothetical protein